MSVESGYFVLIWLAALFFFERSLPRELRRINDGDATASSNGVVKVDFIATRFWLLALQTISATLWYNLLVTINAVQLSSHEMFLNVVGQEKVALCTG